MKQNQKLLEAVKEILTDKLEEKNFCSDDKTHESAIDYLCFSCRTSGAV